MISRTSTLLFALLALGACDLPDKSLGDPLETVGGVDSTSDVGTVGYSSADPNEEGSTTVAWPGGSTSAPDPNEEDSASAPGGSTTTPDPNEGGSTTAGPGGSTTEPGDPTIGTTTGSTSQGPGEPDTCPIDYANWPAGMRACETVDDCGFVALTIDCCGSQAAVGIAEPFVEVIAADEAVCGPSLEVCDCAPDPIKTDDGKTAIDLLHVAFTCQDNVCRTLSANP